METQIAVAVLFAGVYYVLVEDYPKSGVALGLAVLARPDFVLWVAPAYVFLIVRNTGEALCGPAALGGDRRSLADLHLRSTTARRSRTRSPRRTTPSSRTSPASPTSGAWIDFWATSSAPQPTRTTGTASRPSSRRPSPVTRRSRTRGESGRLARRRAGGRRRALDPATREPGCPAIAYCCCSSPTRSSSSASAISSGTGSPRSRLLVLIGGGRARPQLPLGLDGEPRPLQPCEVAAAPAVLLWHWSTRRRSRTAPWSRSESSTTSRTRCGSRWAATSVRS